MLEHGLLGFLAEEPMTGYDLKRRFDNSVSHFWPADQAQIYRTLRRLNDKNLIDCRSVPQDGKPERKEYSLTSTGHDELQRWLISPLDDGVVREPFLLRLFFSGHMRDEAIFELLESRRRQARFLIETLSSVEAESFPDPNSLSRNQRLTHATLRNGLAAAEAELAWLDETEQSLRGTKSE